MSSKNIQVSMKYDKDILSPKIGKKTKKSIDLEYNCNHEQIKKKNLSGWSNLVMTISIK